MPSTIRVVLTCQGFEHTTSRVIFFNQSSVEIVNFESVTRNQSQIEVF